MTDAIVVSPQQGAAIAHVDIATELPQIFQLARALSKATGFIPQHLKNEGEIAAVVLAGRELGLQPMVALRSLSMIKGKVVLAADVMLGLMIRSGVKVEWLADGSPAQGNVAKLKLSRPGHEPYVSTFSIEDAQRAGLSSNDNYKKHQGAMLRARCVSSAARAYCPDVLSGTYVPGELGEDEQQPQSRRQPARRSLDDVAGAAPAPFAAVSIASTPTTQETGSQSESPSAGPTTERDDFPALPGGGTRMEIDQHVEALASCRKEDLTFWIEALRDMEPTADEKYEAYEYFKSRCIELGVDPKSFSKKVAKG
jgi:hypothetical protein